MLPRTFPLMPHEEISWPLVFAPSRIRVRLTRAESINGKHKDVSKYPWLNHSGKVEIAHLGARCLRHSFHDSLGPDDRPGDLDDLIVCGLEVGDAGPVALGRLLQGRNDFSHYLFHDRMPSASGYGPLTELDPFVHAIVWLSIQLIIFHSDNSMDLGSQFLWNPVSDRLDYDGVKVAVYPPLRFEYHISQQIRTQDVILQLEEGFEDIRSFGVVFSGEVITALITYESVAVVPIF